MSEDPDFRAWATRLASKAGKESDPLECERLTSIAEYWKRLADLGDWERDGFRPSFEDKINRIIGFPRVVDDRPVVRQYFGFRVRRRRHQKAWPVPSRVRAASARACTSNRTA
jgi:hypothetical protein